jgi:hypothetical protein
MQDFVANNLDNSLTLNEFSSSSEDEDDENDYDLNSNANKMSGNSFKSLDLNPSEPTDDPNKKEGEEENREEEEDNEYMDEEPQFDTYLKSNQNAEFFKLNYLSVPLIGNFFSRTGFYSSN